jgi:gas vesicle protein GvpO
MAESTREDAKQRRAEDRERRRNMTSEPFERLDEVAGEGDTSGSSIDVGTTVRRAAATAIVAAGIGALAGAAKALLDRRGEQDQEDGSHESQLGSEADEPEARDEPKRGEEDAEESEGRAEPAQDADEADDEPEGRAEPLQDDEEEAPEGAAEPVDGKEDEDDEPEPRAEATDDEDEPEARAERGGEDENDEAEARAEPNDDDDEPQARGESPDADDELEARAQSDDEEEDADLDGVDDAGHAGGEPFEIVPKARRQLARLLGREPESVSAIAREDGHWNVTLEVVELARIPETMDVLASYELALDDEGNVARLTRKRRYQRAHLESEA